MPACGCLLGVCATYDLWTGNFPVREGLDEEEKEEAMLPLKLSLYDELTIDLKEVFEK